MYTAMLIMGVVLYIAVNVYYARSGLLSVFHPFTYMSLFHGLIFVFRPILVYYRDYGIIYRTYGFTPSLSDKLTVLAAADLSFVVFAAVCLGVGNMPMVFKGDRSRAAERMALQPTVWGMLVFLLPIAVYSLLRTFNGEASTMVLSANGVVINTTTNGWISDAKLLLVPICGIAAWVFRFRVWSLMPLLGFVLLKFASGGRGPAVVSIAMFLLYFFYDRRVKLPAGRLLAAGALIIMAFGAVGQDRGAGLRHALGLTIGGRDDVQHTAKRENLRFLEGMDSANLEYFEYIVWVVPKRSGTYDYFLSNLQIFTEPVPRVLWKSKPIGPPVQMINLFDYGFPIGMTYSIPGTGWFELGWFGVAIWSAFWAFALGWFYRWFVTGGQTAMRVIIYFSMLATLIVVFRDGQLLSFVRVIPFYLGPVLLMACWRFVLKIPNLGWIQYKMMQDYRRMGLLSTRIPRNAPMG